LDYAQALLDNSKVVVLVILVDLNFLRFSKGLPKSFFPPQVLLGILINLDVFPFDDELGQRFVLWTKYPIGNVK
jgi:hypothetical protein